MITFKQFLSERPGIGKHGQNANDVSERTMINRIIELCLDHKETEENYDTAYTFLESNWGGVLWNRYYELFHEKAPDFMGPQNKAKFTRFKKEARQLFVKWKNRAKFNDAEIHEDIFAKGDEILAAVNTDTVRRPSEPDRINTNRKQLGRTTGTTRGDPVYYAFSYLHSDESTKLLSSIKGKGPYTLSDVRRDKFIDETAAHMAVQLKASGIKPDVITAPRSSSKLLHTFATALAAKLRIDEIHLSAYRKVKHSLPAERTAAIKYIKQHFVDHAYLDKEYHGIDRVEFEDRIAKGVYSNIRKNDGEMTSKGLDKVASKFVKGLFDVDELDDTLDGKSVLIVDDVLSAGTSMTNLFQIAKDLGAAKVCGAVIFARTSAAKESKLHETADEESDDMEMAKLKNLSKHVFHGRAFVADRFANVALAAVDEGGDGDVLMWHGWMHDSDTSYEISLSSTTKTGITRNLDAIKKAAPRSHISIARKSGMINYHDWSDYT